MANDKPVQIGPLGGAYVEGPGGSKRYLPEMRRWQAMRRNPQVRHAQNQEIRDSMAALRLERFDGLEDDPEAPTETRLREALRARREAVSKGPEVLQGVLPMDVSVGPPRPDPLVTPPVLPGTNIENVRDMKELHAMAARFSPGDPRRGILFAKYRELAATIPQAREIVKGWVGDNFHRAAQALELADDDYSSFTDLYESEMQEGAEKPKTLPGRWAKGIVRREVLAHAREVYADQVDREVQHTMESNWRWRDAASIEEQTNQWYSEHWEGDSSSRPTIADVLGSHDAIYEMISEMSGGTRGVDNDFENRIQEEVQSRIDDIIDRVHRERVEAYEEESDGGDGPGSSGLLSETSAEAVFAGTGIHLSDYTYRHDGGEEVYEAILVQNGRAVGQVERHYDPHERTVYHAYFRLEERAQGGGVAYKMMDNSLHQYLDAGVREVTVSAGLDTGPYAWAKLGFDWKGSESREKAVEYVSSYLQKRGWTPVNAIAKAREVCVHPWTLADWHEPGLDEGSSYKLSTTTDMESVRRIQQSMKKKDDPDWWHTGKRVLLGVSTQLNSGQWAHNSKLYWKGIIRLRTPGDPSWERVKKLYKLGGDETKAA